MTSASPRSLSLIGAAAQPLSSILIAKGRVVIVEPATFVNLDLEIQSEESLNPLAEYLSDCAFVLYNGETDEGYELTVEPILDGKLSEDPGSCTDEFLRLLDSLPDQLVALFRRCRSRIFDYGFDGGLEAAPLAASLAAEQLSRIAAWGIDLRVTVYPYREEPLVADQKRLDA